MLDEATFLVIITKEWTVGHVTFHVPPLTTLAHQEQSDWPSILQVRSPHEREVGTLARFCGSYRTRVRLH